MSNIFEIVSELEKILLFQNLSEKYIIDTLSNNNILYFVELEPLITETKKYMQHNLRNYVSNNNIIVGIFSIDDANINLEIGGRCVLNMQTNKNKFTYLFDNVNFLYPKMLKYHEIKMNVDKKIYLICAKMSSSFENIFKFKIDDNNYYEVLNNMMLKTNGNGQEVDKMI
jgi:hypothetical protein